MAPVKKPRVRVSKNRKKNWNKHSDIKDVEEFLEEKRFEERIGGPVSEKADEELFFIGKDTTETPNSEKKIRFKELKCFQNIGAYSKVPPAINLSLEPFSKKIKAKLFRIDEKRKKKAESAPKDLDKSKKKDDGNLFMGEMRDLWADSADQVANPEIAELITFRDRYTCKKGPKVPQHRYQKPSLLPSVEVPHPGASYNPAFDEHQDLLKKAIEIEKTKKKEELHLKRVLTDMFPSKAEAPTQESVLEEMSQGLFDEEEDSENDDEDSSTLTSRNAPVSADDRLRKAIKRKKKERKNKAILKKVEKLHKKRQDDVFRLKSFKKELKEQEKLTQERILKRQQKKIDKMYQPKVLSRHKYEEPDLEVNLTRHLTDSMRTLKTEGNLLEDRYKSLQRRNLIEPRVKHNHKRKYKLKLQVKRSHRNFE